MFTASFFLFVYFHFYFVIPFLAALISCISPFFFYVNFKCIPETAISKKMKRRKRITKGGRKGKDYLEGIALIQLSQNNQVMSIRRKIYTAWHASVFLFRYISIAMTNSPIFIFYFLTEWYFTVTIIIFLMIPSKECWIVITSWPVLTMKITITQQLLFYKYKNVVRGLLSAHPYFMLLLFIK